MKFTFLRLVGPGASGEHIITIVRGEQALDDIRTSEDNQLLASQLIGFIKSLTEKPDTALHCSIAGGRKTMSAYLLLALTLYGREQDHLTHVLVPEEFESNTKFFFPPRRNQMIPVRRGQNELDIAQTKDAHIELAEIPFIRLRKLLGEGFEKLERGVDELIHLAQRQVDMNAESGPKLIVDLPRREAVFGQQKVGLTGIKLALLAYYADAKANRCVKPEFENCGSCCACFQASYEIEIDRLLRFYERVFPQSPKQFEEKAAQYRKARHISADNLMTYHHAINKAARESQMPEVSSRKEGGKTVYGLALDKTLIEVIE